MLLFHPQRKAWCFHLNVYPYTVPGEYLKHEPVVGKEIYEKYKFISKYLKFSLCNYKSEHAKQKQSIYIFTVFYFHIKYKKYCCLKMH